MDRLNTTTNHGTRQTEIRNHIVKYFCQSVDSCLICYIAAYSWITRTCRNMFSTTLLRVHNRKQSGNSLKQKFNKTVMRNSDLCHIQVDEIFDCKVELYLIGSAAELNIHKSTQIRGFYKLHRHHKDPHTYKHHHHCQSSNQNHIDFGIQGDIETP